MIAPLLELRLCERQHSRHLPGGAGRDPRGEYRPRAELRRRHAYGGGEATGSRRCSRRACDVFFVFNGTAANALVLAALCQRHHAILCHELSHVETDECGAPEFFTGGSKVLPVAGANAKAAAGGSRAGDASRARRAFPENPRAVAHPIHRARDRRTRADEIARPDRRSRTPGLAVHVDGARFANAAAALQRAGHFAGGPHLARWRRCAVFRRDEERAAHDGSGRVFQS